MEDNQMPIADKMVKIVKSASMIRKMFEEGIRMKEKYGADNVYDFSLGNPDIAPPAAVKETLLSLLNDPGCSHGYMPNAGYPHVKKAVADYLNKEFNVGLTPELIVMTAGAAGALNDILKALINPGEDILVPVPYFVGYNQYAFVAGANLKLVASTHDFHLDLEAVEKAITANTRVMLINSPNNPTGAVYDKKELTGLGKVLDAASLKFGKRIYLISDEPYRKIAYGVEVPSVFDAYPHTIVLTSYSKELSLAGERIGYLAIHPKAEDADIIAGAAGVANTMMYVNAPSLFQQVVGRVQGVTVDIEIYKKRRDILCQGLLDAGYELDVPKGAFYLFPKSPISDDVKFVKILQENRILAVPGSGFGGPGHFRLSYAVPDNTIADSIEYFKKAIEGSL
jgi:aspartate aminotransferase